MEDDLSLHLQSVWQSSKIGFYCLNAAASAELVEIFFFWGGDYVVGAALY